MNTGGETANIIMAFIAEIGKDQFRIGGELLKFLVIDYLNNKGNLNAGEVSMKKMLESGEEIKSMDLNIKDTRLFAKMGKQNGISFALFSKGDDGYTVSYLVKQAEFVNTILDNIKSGKVKEINNFENKSIVDSYVIGSNKEKIDKDIQEKNILKNSNDIFETILVDKSNPDNHVKMREDLKNNIIEAEITVAGKTSKVSGKDAVTDEMIKYAKEFKTVEWVENESEIEKLKEQVIAKKEDKKTLEQVEKQVKEVREKMPKQQKKQKNKSKERSDR